MLCGIILNDAWKWRTKWTWVKTQWNKWKGLEKNNYILRGKERKHIDLGSSGCYKKFLRAQLQNRSKYLISLHSQNSSKWSKAQAQNPLWDTKHVHTRLLQIHKALHVSKINDPRKTFPCQKGGIEIGRKEWTNQKIWLWRMSTDSWYFLWTTWSTSWHHIYAFQESWTAHLSCLTTHGTHYLPGRRNPKLLAFFSRWAILLAHLRL